MHRALNRLLLAIALPLVLLDAAWIALGHFSIDARNYALVAGLVAPLAAASLWYDHARDEPRLSATLAVASFLIVFPAAASLYSYLAVTIAGPRIDGLLAAADLALGFHWTALMGWAAAHPWINAVFSAAYLSVLPQTVLLLFVLGMSGRLEALYGLALALAFGAIITLAIWTALPSFGAFSVFALPDAVAAKLGLALGADYGRILENMLAHGPGLITPVEIRGLVGFPSYHTLQALVLAWFGWRAPVWRWVALPLNLAVLAAIPVEGGHHLMDMAGGVAVTAAALALAMWCVTRAQAPKAAAALRPALAAH